MSASATLDPLTLDPGIRDVVCMLRGAGFDTTDSGDGRSKGVEGLPYRHVFCRSTKDAMCEEARRLAGLLPISWAIQASYDPRDGSAVLLATETPPDAHDA